MYGLSCEISCLDFCIRLGVQFNSLTYLDVQCFSKKGWNNSLSADQTYVSAMEADGEDMNATSVTVEDSVCNKEGTGDGSSVPNSPGKVMVLHLVSLMKK
ncbi:hypothetical protein V6N13_137852 [Hibiscus sabdariffa]|uniref:Uncharacterized protein n=1 Tax=Hibiscus sabdariffa TaxID=183260 RepID=A0ABR2DKA4_9ROSI